MKRELGPGHKRDLRRLIGPKAASLVKTWPAKLRIPLFETILASKTEDRRVFVWNHMCLTEVRRFGHNGQYWTTSNTWLFDKRYYKHSIARIKSRQIMKRNS